MPKPLIMHNFSTSCPKELFSPLTWTYNNLFSLPCFFALPDLSPEKLNEIWDNKII